MIAAPVAASTLEENFSPEKLVSLSLHIFRPRNFSFNVEEEVKRKGKESSSKPRLFRSLFN
jgi:hypothetical protein